MRTRSATLALSLLFALAPAAQAFTLSANYVNPDDWSPAQQAVITQALSDWKSSVTANTAPSTTVTINFYSVHAGTAYLGQWQFGGQVPVPFAYSPGIVHNIFINSDYAASESFSLDAPPADAYDFLTIVRHELGHAMGFTDRVYVDGSTDRWASHIDANGIFDPSGLAVPMRADNNHVNLTDDLMYYSLPKGVRRDISSTDIAMLDLAYGYVPVPEPASLALLGLGTLSLVALRRRRTLG